MREKIYRVLNNVYAVLMFISFFASLLPVIPFIVALFIDSATASAMVNFLCNEYYKYVFLGASVSVLIGLIAMYVGSQATGKKKKNQ